MNDLFIIDEIIDAIEDMEKLNKKKVLEYLTTIRDAKSEELDELAKELEEDGFLDDDDLDVTQYMK